MSTRTVKAQFTNTKTGIQLVAPQLFRCPVCSELATHSTTDSQQQADGTFTETAPRHGCIEHAVTPNVILIDGTVVPFEQYQVQ